MDEDLNYMSFVDMLYARIFVSLFGVESNSPAVWQINKQGILFSIK
jgi:hypothetical protein